MAEPAAPGPDGARRHLPSVDALLRRMPELLAEFGHRSLRDALRAALAELRERLGRGERPACDVETLRAAAARRLAAARERGLKPVLNLTGTVLHTNLGRASLPPEAIDSLCAVAGAPSNLEFDLASGARGERESHVEGLLRELTGAEAATAVNNNAAAVLLILNTLAMHREVPVSRGELVEIGGSFRIPEVMRRANCTLVEVGATNRTHLRDYEDAINANTALLMKVHCSNYRVQGFTSAVRAPELAALASSRGLPLALDLGSGSLVDLAALGLPAEPTAAAAIAAGADVVSFSGDKLLGGPQAGIIAGRRELLGRIGRNPLKRALRLDKLTLAALAAVLELYRHPERLARKLPTLRHLSRPAADIRAQAERLLPALRAALGDRFAVSVADCRSQVGSGSLPVATLPSAALLVSASDSAVRGLGESLRAAAVPVLGRIHKGALWLDCRCLDDEALLLRQFAGLAS